ncbi:opioid growth factor receptor [Plakobranchus ocellatus]|uniref:Opioid growth factor receptor n=1 Tax=Plakobranchus ocellatus TaxID=259542 RepID=A0AAV4DIC5_9GAST|nr:opioid growth factor receptor [Plakobranchus ocellatus]
MYRLSHTLGWNHNSKARTCADFHIHWAGTTTARPIQTYTYIGLEPQQQGLYRLPHTLSWNRNCKTRIDFHIHWAGTTTARPVQTSMYIGLEPQQQDPYRLPCTLGWNHNSKALQTSTYIGLEL